MVKCTFSGEEIEPGTGLIYVTKEGKVLYFKNFLASKASKIAPMVSTNRTAVNARR